MVPSTEKVAVAGLGRLAGWIFFLAGGIAGSKGLWDCFRGQPEANFFSPHPWMFVTHVQWTRYAGFELTFALACLGLSLAARIYSRRLPDWIERPTPPGL